MLVSPALGDTVDIRPSSTIGDGWGARINCLVYPGKETEQQQQQQQSMFS